MAEKKGRDPLEVIQDTRGGADDWGTHDDFEEEDGEDGRRSGRPRTRNTPGSILRKYKGKKPDGAISDFEG